ncbi:hypothetical protein AB0J47_18360 [Nocardia sp. NPDC049737]|uniref:hypothetical protein n=1 Tax=Nocardia sp. NPDC049737 TaxID=3154358 RepID=UPI00342D9716
MPTSHDALPQWRKVLDAEIRPWLEEHRACGALEGGTTSQACGAKWWLLQQHQARGLTFSDVASGGCAASRLGTKQHEGASHAG